VGRLGVRRRRLARSARRSAPARRQPLGRLAEGEPAGRALAGNSGRRVSEQLTCPAGPRQRAARSLHCAPAALWRLERPAREPKVCAQRQARSSSAARCSARRQSLSAAGQLCARSLGSCTAPPNRRQSDPLFTLIGAAAAPTLLRSPHLSKDTAHSRQEASRLPPAATLAQPSRARQGKLRPNGAPPQSIPSAGHSLPPARRLWQARKCVTQARPTQRLAGAR